VDFGGLAGARSAPLQWAIIGAGPAGRCDRTDPLGAAIMSTPDQLYDEATELRDQGDKEGAIAKLSEAVAIDPNYALGHGMLAKLYADQAQADEAIFHARRVVELEPNDVFSYTALSVIYQRCGKIPEAEEAKAKAYYKQMGYE
jgi:Flp pilus assembly protein TadD